MHFALSFAGVTTPQYPPQRRSTSVFGVSIGRLSSEDTPRRNDPTIFTLGEPTSENNDPRFAIFTVHSISPPLSNKGHFGLNRFTQTVSIVLLAASLLGGSSDGWAQQSPPPKSPPPKSPPPNRTLNQSQSAEAERWMEWLGSKNFSRRERAAEELIELGEPVVPLLRQFAKQTSNAEVKLRAESLINQLNNGDLQSRIEAFLKGEKVDFQGWNEFRLVFGDSLRARDLFIELLRNYPTLVESFDGTDRNRAQAMEKVAQTLATKRSDFRKRLTIADAVAMLIPIASENVPLDPGYERQMLMLLRLAPASSAPNDPVIGPSFTRLLNVWVQRSTLENRESVLYYAIQANLTAAYPLAIQTLGETREPKTLATAMQVIARHKRVADQALVEPFLNDNRQLVVFLHARGKQSQVRVCDVAMATIAKLHNVPLDDIGFPRSAENSKFGFIYEDLVFNEAGKSPTPIDQQRSNAMAKVKRLIKDGKLTPTP